MYIEVKIKRENEDEKVIQETYLFNANSYSDAEKYFLGIKGFQEILYMKKVPFDEVRINDSKLFFECKYMTVVLTDRGTETSVNIKAIVQAENITQAKQYIEGRIGIYGTLKSIKETNIIEYVEL